MVFFNKFRSLKKFTIAAFIIFSSWQLWAAKAINSKKIQAKMPEKIQAKPQIKLQTKSKAIFQKKLPPKNLRSNQDRDLATVRLIKKSSFKKNKTKLSSKYKIASQTNVAFQTNVASKAKVLSKVEKSIQLESVYLYNSTIKSYIGKIYGFAVAKNIIAARLPESTLGQLQNDVQFIISRDKSYALQVLDINLLNRWMIFYTDAPKLVILDSDKISNRFLDFEYFKKEQLLQDWQAVNEMLKTAERAPSSRPLLSEIIEKRLIEYEGRITTDLINSQKIISVGQYSSGPLEASANCKKKSIVVNLPDFLSDIKSAQGVECQSENRVTISETEKINYSLTSGVLVLNTNVVVDKNQRKLLITNLLTEKMDEIKKFSYNVSESGPVVCQFSTINENQMDVHLCIRNYRLFNNLADTVLIVGQQTLNEYRFTQLRAEGFQTVNTKKIINKFLSMVGEQRW